VRRLQLPEQIDESPIAFESPGRNRTALHRGLDRASRFSQVQAIVEAAASGG
jgi:hypothetical protein